MARHVDTQCEAFQTAVEVLSRPWTAMILNALQSGERRFSELTEACDGVTDKVLSTRLKDLEARGLLQRSVDAGPPVRVSYTLTKSGRAFSKVADAIELWGRDLVAATPPRPARRAPRA